MKEKKQKKDKKVKLKTVQSTQQNIPIKEFIDGVVATKDGNFYKIIEIFPTAFLTKSNTERNNISIRFRDVLNTCPKRIHIKSVSNYPDLTSQKISLVQQMKKIKNINLQRMAKEFYQTIQEAEYVGTQKRYFLSISYDDLNEYSSTASLSERVNDLNFNANQIASALNDCGNNTKIFEDYDNASLFYNLLNRYKYRSRPYRDNAKEISDKYEDNFIPSADLVAPQSISFNSPRYVCIDGVYYSYFFIPSEGYPQETYAGWLNNIVDSYAGIDVDIFLERDKKYNLDTLRKKLNNTEGDKETTSSSAQGYQFLKNRSDTINYLLSALNNYQDIYHMSILITMSGASPEEIDEKYKYISKLYKSRFATTIYDLKYQEEQAFQSVFPCAFIDERIQKKAQRLVATEAAADSYIFTSGEILEEGGILFAENLDSHSPISRNSFSKNYHKDPHIFCIGETGSGKSVSLMSIACRNTLMDKPVYIFAPYKQHEYARLCEMVNGQFISIGVGSKTVINPLEIFPLSKEALKVRQELKDDAEKYSLLLQKIAMVLSFIKIKYPNISPIEEEILDSSLLELYKNFGITEDNDSLWDETHSRYKEMPILSDLYDLLTTKGEDARNISAIVRGLTIGKYKHFNGKTNFDINNGFFVIGLENNTKEVMPLSYFIAMEFVWQQAQQNPIQEKVLIMDEWWILAKNQYSADRSLEIAKLARAYACQVIIATQQLSDSTYTETAEFGQKVVDACSTKIILKPGDNDIENVVNLLKLTPQEEKRLMTFKDGKGLYITPSIRLPIYFNISETEKLLYFTDKKSIEKYQAIEEKRREIQTTEKMDSIFVKKEKYKVFDDKKPTEEKVESLSDIFK